MCRTSPDEVLTGLRCAARQALSSLDRSSNEVAAVAADMSTLLEKSAPIVSPLPWRAAGQLNAEAVIRHPLAAYPALLADVIGPPLKVGSEEWLGYVTSECALAALRRHDVQASLAMLFLSTLCADRLPAPGAEALAHLLTMSDRTNGAVGLFELGASRQRSSKAEVTALRARLGLQFTTTAIQILGTWGPPGRLG